MGYLTTDFYRLSEKKTGEVHLSCFKGYDFLGRVVGFEPTIFWATTRRVNPYTTPAITEANAIISSRVRQQEFIKFGQFALKTMPVIENIYL